MSVEESSSMKIAVWEELVDQIAEDVTIEFTSIKLIRLLLLITIVNTYII